MATTNDWQHAWLRIREFARMWYTLRVFASSNVVTTGNWTAMENLIRRDKCVFDPDVQQGEDVGILGQRSFIAGLLSNGRAILDPLLLQISRAMGYPQVDPLAVFPILYRYMAVNEGSFKSAPRVQSRAFTRGSWTAGASNQGNGTVLRQVVDRYDLPLEADAPDALKSLCVQDANSGTNPGAEQFRVTGRAFQDAIARYNSDKAIGLGTNISTQNLVGVEGVATRSLIQNPSFSDFAGTGATSTFALSNWEVVSGMGALASVDTTNYYRKSNVETTPGALKITGTSVIKQKIPAGQLNAALCYMLQAACNFSIGGATGSVRMRLGTEATYLVDVTVNSGVAGWNLIRPTIDKKLYAANFVGPNDVYVRFDITLTGGTSILLDDFCMSEFQNIGGKLLWAIGGSNNWVVQDTGTITDSVATTANSPTVANVQTMLAEVYGRALPAYTPSTAPTAATIASTTGGTTARGRYGVVITFYNGTTLLESAPSAEHTVTLDATNNQIALTNIPLGPGGTTDRYIHVTQMEDWNDTTQGFGTNIGPESAYYFAAALGDNTTTSKTFDPAAVIDLTKPLAPQMDI